MAENVSRSMTFGVTMINILHKPPSMAMVETKQVTVLVPSAVRVQKQPCIIRGTKATINLPMTSILPPRLTLGLSALKFLLPDGRVPPLEVWAHMDVPDQLKLRIRPTRDLALAATVMSQILSEDAHSQATKDTTRDLGLAWAREAMKNLFVDTEVIRRYLVGRVQPSVSQVVVPDLLKARAVLGLEATVIILAT